MGDAKSNVAIDDAFIAIFAFSKLASLDFVLEGMGCGIHVHPLLTESSSAIINKGSRCEILGRIALVEACRALSHGGQSVSVGSVRKVRNGQLHYPQQPP